VTDYTEDQLALAQSAARLFDKHYAFEARKALIASPLGRSDAVWQQLGELGLHAAALPEAADGLGGSVEDLLASMEAAGRALVLEPLAQCQSAAAALLAAGDVKHVKAIAAGSIILPAFQEAASRYTLDAPTARFADGKLSGEKRVVLHAPSAQGFLVSCTHQGKFALVYAAADAPGIKQHSLRTVDNLRAADLQFANTPATLVAEGPAALNAAALAQDTENLLHAAEALGLAEEACALTLDYLKTRKQFGQAIGAFQALQHRMVDMTISRELMRSMLMLTAQSFQSAEPKARSRAISAMKVKFAEGARHIGQEAIQLHGGMGMTQEMKISHVFKRLTMLAQQGGDMDFHLARYASGE
jgi:alkylation response protein AidB-like acyl-CoA dehydrogenase